MNMRATVVVPAFDERDDVEPLFGRLERALATRAAEVLPIEDSTNGTEDTVAGVALTAQVPLSVIGFESLLEILLPHELAQGEVAFRFKDRTFGRSKATVAGGPAFLRQLAGLRRKRGLSAVPVALLARIREPA